MTARSFDTLALPDGGTLAYQVRGAGPPLLLVRPLGGSMLSWGAFATQLATHVQVIAFDARGTGASSHAPLGTSTRSMARDARALLDHLAIPRAHVYGISLGGMVASWLALDAPERVGQLVLASTLPRGAMVHAPSLRKALSYARCLLAPAPEAEARLAERILSTEFRARHPAAVAEIRAAAAARPASHRALLTLLWAAYRHDVVVRLHEIDAPVRVLIGARDPLLTLASQRELLGPLRRATYDVIEGAGHDVSAEAPALVAERVLEAVGAFRASRGEDGAVVSRPRAS